MIDIKEKVEPDNGIFVLAGEINNNSVVDVIQQMFIFSDKNPDKIITLYIDSEGGSITAGMTIYDVITFLPNQVKTIAIGKTMGIAAVILAAGTMGMRLADPETEIGFGQFYGKKNVEEIPKEVYSVIEKIYSVLAKHTGKTIVEIREVVDEGRILDVNQAMEFGVIDNTIV